MLVRMCDICGKKIDESGDFSQLALASFSGGEVAGYQILRGVDICAECVSKRTFLDMLTSAIQQHTEEPEEIDTYSAPAPTEEKPKKRRQFDIGKARALRTAGWTYTAIADEMKCSPQTVINYLNKTKEETTT